LSKFTAREYRGYPTTFTHLSIAVFLYVWQQQSNSTRQYITAENYFISKGDWFTITIDRRVSVVLQENKTDKKEK
jgi:hypothetical protein